MPAQDATQGFDVAVVGGGVIGLTVAWRSARDGARVVLLEREPDLGACASHVAAGMIAPVSEADVGERALLELGQASAARWPAFAAELADASGADPGYRPCGALAVARDRDEAEALERELGFREQLGLPATRLRPSQARTLEPALAPTLRLALHVPGDHAADPRALTAALAAAARAAGADVRPGRAVAHVAGDGLALDDGARIAAAQVVVGTGAWAGSVPGLPAEAQLPVRPVKGQILRLRDPEGPGLLQRVVRYEGGYLVPRGDGRYVLGATMEERGFDTTVTAGAVLELLRDAAELVPGVQELIVEEVAAGLRPATPDNRPCVGRSAHVDGLVWATGHHRNGILLAPLTADLVAAALRGETAPAAVDPGRFARVPA